MRVIEAIKKSMTTATEKAVSPRETIKTHEEWTPESVEYTTKYV